MDFVTSEDRVQGLVDLVARWSISQRRRVAGSAVGVVAGREAARAAKMVADLNAEELERACGCDDLLVKCAVYPLLCPVLERLLEKGAKANGARRGGLSLLHVAAIWDNEPAMRALLKKQADVAAGPRLKRLKRNRAAAELETCGAPEPWTCPGCGNRTTDAPAAHPDFDAVRVPVCWECRWMRDQGTFDVGDDGNEEFCRLCGEGGDLLLCDTDGCSRSHCAGCVERVTGRGAAAAESSVWHCFQCDRASLEEARVAHQWDAIFEAYEARLSKRARAMARKAWTLVGDLSNGAQARAVPCVGRAERAPPVKVFEYEAKPVVPRGGAVKPVENAGCDCRIGNFVFECHDDCNCRAAACRNRVVGAGLKLPLEVFHTGTDKGWGVRCRDKITKGTFVAAYGGEILTQDEAEERGRKRGDEYFLDCRAPPPQRAAAVVSRGAATAPSRAPAGRPRRPRRRRDAAAALRPRATSSSSSTPSGKAVARFFNHSCVPNMRGATVYVESDMPRLAFFALKDIRKGTELTWDYKRTQNETDGVPCLCGYANCREGRSEPPRPCCCCC
ncbi:SET domain-containing protein [Aureococcus anophagefferens]|nr:SET domain-containing protein [Aureococcus anophagefferens]